jgi:hypothetical protein
LTDTAGCSAAATASAGDRDGVARVGSTRRKSYGIRPLYRGCDDRGAYKAIGVGRWGWGINDNSVTCWRGEGHRLVEDGTSR